MKKRVGLSDFRRHLRKYIELLKKGWKLTIVDKRRGVDLVTLVSADYSS